MTVSLKLLGLLDHVHFAVRGHKLINVILGSHRNMIFRFMKDNLLGDKAWRLMKNGTNSFIDFTSYGHKGFC